MLENTHRGSRTGRSCEHQACFQVSPLTSLPEVDPKDATRQQASWWLPIKQTELKLSATTVKRRSPVYFPSPQIVLSSHRFYFLCSYEFITFFPLYGHFGRISGGWQSIICVHSATFNQNPFGFNIIVRFNILKKIMGRMRPGEGNFSQEKKPKWERREDGG